MILPWYRSIRAIISLYGSWHWWECIPLSLWGPWGRGWPRRIDNRGNYGRTNGRRWASEERQKHANNLEMMGGLSRSYVARHWIDFGHEMLRSIYQSNVEWSFQVDGSSLTEQEVYSSPKKRIRQLKIFISSYHLFACCLRVAACTTIPWKWNKRRWSHEWVVHCLTDRVLFLHFWANRMKRGNDRLLEGLS